MANSSAATAKRHRIERVHLEKIAVQRPSDEDGDNGADAPMPAITMREPSPRIRRRMSLCCAPIALRTAISFTRDPTDSDSTP